MPIDPLTAVNNGISMLFNFLATPQGQLCVADMRAANAKLAGQISDFIDHLHGQVVPKAGS